MIFDHSLRLKFIILTLIYYIIHSDVCNGSAVTPSNVCEFENGQQIYCNCDNVGVDEARYVTCFIVNSNGLTPTALVWNGFALQRNITSLMFTTRFDAKLTFLPVNALTNIADSLDTLNVNEMSLGVLEKNSIIHFDELTKINFESNEIRGLSESTFAHLPALKSLSLSSNFIEVLKANVLIDLPKLEEIFLDRNLFTTLEDNAFIELNHLRELDLRLNKINNITSLTFSGLSSLKRLDLSRNQLKVIPNYAFTGTPLLRELDLNQNQIITIEDNAFHNMSHLMSLQLNENKIQYLSTAIFRGSPPLVLIDLSKNNLETIERELVDSLQHLQQEQFVIYLRENPLQCDCRLLWLTNISHTVGKLFKSELKHIKCTVMKEFADLKMNEQIKVLRLGHNESIISACQTRSTTEEVINVDNGNEGQNSFPAIVNKMEHNITNINLDNLNNHIDDEQYFAAKTHLSDSTESILHDVENSIENHPIEPNDSQVKSNKLNNDKGGVFRVHCDANIVISCLLVFIFCKNRFI